MSASDPFLPGYGPAWTGPLARYLPPIPSGVAHTWLKERLQQGDWVLDPFGTNPALAVEAARSGWRVLVAANNPVARFLLEMAANPPSEQDLRAALAELSASFKGEERIEPHIQGLYATECAQCGAEISAEAFIWDRGGRGPFARLYRCPHCGDAGEHPATQADVQRAVRFSSSGLHRARALERIAPPDDPDRSHAEEAVNAYLPRAVYALITLVNKLEGISPEHRRNLEALLLAAADQACVLWPYPTARARPRQLTIPPRFRERNVWMAMEEALNTWSNLSGESPADQGNAPGGRVPVAYWPELPPEKGGLCIFEGRLKDLGQSLRSLIPARDGKSVAIKAVLSALPRPNQAYWTLSALWAGWLWGREAAAPFKGVLRRRRYDWSWHTAALHAAMISLAPIISPGAPFLGLIGEAEPGFLSAALLAAEMAGFKLASLNLRSQTSQAQITWSLYADRRMAGSGSGEDLPRKTTNGHRRVQDVSRSAAQQHLIQRGQPCDYLYLHAAALFALIEKDLINPSASPPAETQSQIQNAFQQAFTFRSGFLRYGGSEHSLEVGLWWLWQIPKGEQPVLLSLSDRIEMAVVAHLLKNPGASFHHAEAALCRSFTGLFTPERELLKTCLDSYASRENGGKSEGEADSGKGYRIRDADLPSARRAELDEMRRHLFQLGERLGYSVTDEPAVQPGGKPAVLWRDEQDQPAYTFFVIASAVLSELLYSFQEVPPGVVIVYPGGRASLIAYKLESDPRLRQALEQGWHMVKFRHLRRLAASSQISRENFAEQLELDPLANSDPQLHLL